MKRKILKALKITGIVIVTLVILGLVGGSAFVGKMVRDGILYQNQGNDTKDNSLKQLETWGYDTDAFFAAYAGEDFVVESEDGTQVPGTTYKTENSKGYVILVHGAGGDRNAVLPVAEIFLRNDYSVITYDQRGSGDNSNEEVTFGIREKEDVRALVDYARNELSAAKVIVCGQSMGGMTTALYAATDHAYDNVDAVILDSPIPSMSDMLIRMFEEDGTDETTANYILTCGKIYCSIFEGLSFDEGETTELMKNNRCKTLVIVSEQDEICLPEEVRALYEGIASEDKDILSVDSAHIEGSIVDTEDYEQGIMNFLENN